MGGINDGTGDTVGNGTALLTKINGDDGASDVVVVNVLVCCAAVASVGVGTSATNRSGDDGAYESTACRRRCCRCGCCRVRRRGESSCCES